MNVHLGTRQCCKCKLLLKSLKNGLLSMLFLLVEFPSLEAIPIRLWLVTRIAT